MLARDDAGRAVAAVAADDSPAAHFELDRLRRRYLHERGVVPGWLEQLVEDLARANALHRVSDVAHLVDSQAERGALWVTTAEVVALLGRSPATIRRWIVAGDFPGARQTAGGHWLVPISEALARSDRKDEHARTDSVAAVGRHDGEGQTHRRCVA